MMSEVPSNAVLAEDFLKHVDGFSIGSNDVTRSTLAISISLDPDTVLETWPFLAGEAVPEARAADAAASA